MRQRLIVAAMVMAMAIPGAAHGADIHVMSGGAPKEVFALLVPQFEAQSGHKVIFTYAVMSALRDKLAAGDKADVLVMPVPLLDGLQKDGKVRSESRVVFGTVGVSMVMREGGPKPDISTPEAFKQALLHARSVVHPTPGETPTGSHMGKLIEQLGIATAMAGKIIHRPALKGGVDLVASGEAELGIYPASEVVNIKGLTVIGPLPAALQLTIVYGAAVTADSAAAEPAAALLRFLASPANRAHWRAAGFTPPAH